MSGNLQKIFEIWVRWLLKIYPLLLVLGLGAAFFAFPRMIHLFKNISTDPMDLLPRDFPSVQALLKIRDKVETTKRFGIVLESDHPENTLRLVNDLKPLLEKVPSVGEVLITKEGYDFFDTHKLLYLELADLEKIRDRVRRKIQHEKLGALYVSFEDEEDEGDLNFSDLEGKYKERSGSGADSPYFVSPNGKIYAVYMQSREGNLSLAQETKYQDAVKKAVQDIDLKSYDPTMKLYFAGSTRVMEYRALVNDLKIAGMISGVLIFLPLLIRFRRPQYVLLIFLPLGLGVPSGLALASLWIQKLNVTTSFLFAILGGLGVETGIHLFSRYREKRRGGDSVEAALLDLYLYMGPAILTAVASLAVTFLLMAVNDFRGFSEFGLISGIGLWTVFIYYFTFFPALLILAEKIHLLKISGGGPEREISFRMSPAFVKTLLVIFSLFTVFSILVTPRIQFEYNSKKTRADDPANRLAKEKQRSTAGNRVNAPAVVLIQSEEEADAITATVRQRRDSNPKTTLDYTSSVYSLVPKQQNEKMKVIGEIQKLLEDDTIKLVKDERKKDLDKFKKAVQQSKSVEKALVPKKIEEMFLGRKEVPGSLLLIHPKPRLELDDGRNAIAFAAEVGEIPTSRGIFHASSDAVVYADVLKTMFRDSKKVLIISVVSVFFFVFLNFRSLKKTLLVMFSILAGVVWVMGVMYLARIKLNLYNMVMIPAIMGMSIDNSIHIYHRYEELGRGSLSKVLSTAGLSSLLASTTNAAGFLGLVFCTHGGLRSMGVVATIGLATCLITTLVYLPMILQFLENRSLKTESV